MRCPRCDGQTLDEGRFQGVPVARCPGCGGLAVEVRHNVGLLDALARELAAHVSLDTEIPPQPGPEGVAACPRCARPTTRFGYLGTNRVFLDRCEACLLLWHDGDELGTTAALHARTTLRSEDRARARREAIDEQNRRFHLVLVAREAMERGFRLR